MTVLEATKAAQECYLPQSKTLGSVAIVVDDETGEVTIHDISYLNQFKSPKPPVPANFGQCWVFSGLLVANRVELIHRPR